ncbi:hypothetical protein DIPPA_22219 [Diplonema papillatum]|nr:hypothetical protein DIPPA_22219 [Diplonema papillatum]
MSIFQRLFGQKKKTPQELQREWKSVERSEIRKLERQLRQIQAAEKKTQTEARAAAKKGENDVVKILAKEIVRSRKASQRIMMTKTQLKSVGMALDGQVATFKIAGAMQQSSAMLREMNRLMRVPEVANVMSEMQREMCKAGMIQEKMDDVIDDVVGVEDESDDAEDEIEKVMREIVDVGALPSDKLPAAAKQEAEAEDDDNDLEERLKALKAD